MSAQFKQLAFTVCGVVIFVVSISLFAQDAETQQAQSASDKTTVYEFEGGELRGQAKGPSNVFLKVGELKNPKLLEMRQHFRPEMRRSLDLVR